MSAFPVDGGAIVNGTSIPNKLNKWTVSFSNVSAGDYATLSAGSLTDGTDTTDVNSEVVTVTVTGQAPGSLPATMKWDKDSPTPLSAERLEAKGSYTLAAGAQISGKITISAFPTKGGRPVYVQVDPGAGNTFSATFNAPVNTYSIVASATFVQGGMGTPISTPVVTKTTKK